MDNHPLHARARIQTAPVATVELGVPDTLRHLVEVRF
jgi:hypothetical protein